MSPLSPGERAGVRASVQQTSSDLDASKSFIICRSIVGSLAFDLSDDDSDEVRHGSILAAEVTRLILRAKEEVRASSRRPLRSGRVAADERRLRVDG